MLLVCGAWDGATVVLLSEEWWESTIVWLMTISKTKWEYDKTTIWYQNSVQIHSTVTYGDRRPTLVEIAHISLL